MPRKQKCYHLIYKTVNQVNGKYYIGMHSTDKLEDGYIGSGQMLWHAIKKYGRENFKREDLEFFPDRKTLKDREKQIVNEKFVKDPMCMNIKLGGGSGPEEHTLTTREKISNAHRGRKLSEQHRQNIGIASSNRTEETHKKLSESRRKWKLSKETCDKIQEHKRNHYWNSEKGINQLKELHRKMCNYEIPILQIQNGIIVKEWSGLSEIRISHPEWGTCSNISRMLKNEKRKQAYGFEWRVKS